MSRRKISWSELPSELLSVIAGRLETRTDLRKFRAVCSSWRRSAPISLLPHENLLSSLLPHKIITSTPPLLDKNRSNRMYWEIPGKSLIIVPCSVFLLRPSRKPEVPPWLITVEELNPGKFYLRKPLSRINILDLPENFPKNLQLSDFQVIELAKFCTLRLSDRPWDMFENKHWRNCTERVIIFVDPKHRINPTIDNCIAMVLYDSGTLSSIRLNNEEEKHLNPKGRKFDDILEFKGKIYAVDRRGRLYCTSYNSLSMLEVIEEALGEGSGTDKKKRLVELLGELYVVYRCHGPRKNIDFEVHRLQEKEGEWETVKDICDVRILFVTLDGCFFANKNYFPNWRGNSIVYYKNTFPQYKGPSLGISVFGSKYYYDDELGIGMFHFDGGRGIGGYGWAVASSSRYSEVFWPPPVWLSPDAELGTSFSKEEEEKGSFEEEEEEEEEEGSSEEGEEEEEGSSEEEEEDEDSSEEGEEEGSSEEGEEEGEGSFNEQGEKRQSGYQGEINQHPLLQVVISPTLIHVAGHTKPIDTTFTKDVQNGVSQSKFQGINVSPHLIPVLKKIWDKHGNIMQGHVMQNNGQLTWALESLANIIIHLQSESGMSLNNFQAAHLNSTMNFLLGMRFRLDWLIPFVQKALAVHNEQQQVHYMNGLEMSKANLVAQLHDLDWRLAQQRKVLADMAVAAAPLARIELKNVLG